MRRLWAYIALAFSALFIMSTSFTRIFLNINSNHEFNGGKEIVFKLQDKENPSNEVEEDANKAIADEMAYRLEKSNITSYRISLSGSDYIKVDISEKNDVNRNNLIDYLSFNGSLALSNKDDNDNYYQITGDEFLLEGSKTYLDNINSFPAVVIPVDVNNDDFKLLLENTNKQKEEGIGETTGEGEEAKTTTYIYLWYDFNEETDRYSRTVEGSEDYDENIAKKIIMKFNIEDLWYPDGDENKLCAVLNLDMDNNEELTFKEIQDGYNNARFYVNLLNSSELAYDVININDNYDININPWVETLIKYGDPNSSLSMSRTLIATIVAIVVICAILAMIFRLSSVSILVSSITTLFAVLGLFVTIGAEFNIASLIGFIVLSIAALTVGIVNACKLKDEAYKGRSLKKANTEASKKTLLFNLDISIILIVLGAMTYLLGGVYMKGFALIMVLGAIFNFLVYQIIHRFMMYLATNTTALTNKYEYFGIDSKNVPSIVNEEKQKYYSPFDNKDFHKHNKPVTIVTLILLVLGFTSLVVSSNVFKGQYYKQNSDNAVTEIYFETNNSESIITTNDYVKENILTLTTVKVGNDNKALTSYLNNIDSYSHTEKVNNVDITTTYIVASFNTHFATDTQATYDDISGNIDDVLYAATLRSDSHAIVGVKDAQSYSSDTPHASGIMLATIITSIIMGAYFMIRYRLSRGVIALIMPIITTTISAGFLSFLSLLNVSINPYTVLIMPFTYLITSLLMTVFMNKERELIVEDRNKGDLLEIRNNIMKKANAIAFVPIGIMTLIAAYLAIDYFGFGANATSLIFISLLLGVLISSALVTLLFGPLSHLIYKQLLKHDITIKPRKKKKNGNIKPNKRSSEPEEAIFFGIND